MVSPRIYHSPLLLSLTYLCIFRQTAAAAAAAEFLKLPLLHRTPHPTATQALSLDSRRIASLNPKKKPSTNSPLTSGASFGTGQYFVSVHLGAPPQRLLLVADTGSDLVWARCSACRNCTHHPPATSFFPRRSSTFRPHHCYATACRLVPRPESHRCNRTRLHSPCRYEYSYSDGSLTSGFFSVETTTVNTTAAVMTELRLNFGCAFKVSGPSVTGASFTGAEGVLGLGRGPISFSSQLGRRFGHRFSYCLIDYTLSPPPASFLVIGGGATAAKMSFTPLLSNPISPTFYYITILTVSIDGENLPVSPSVWAIDGDGNGGTIVDSGTTLSFFHAAAYRQIVAVMRRRIKLPRAAVPTPGFDLCLNVSENVKPRFPRLKFKLAGGSKMSPPARNYFIDTAEGVKCLAIQAVKTEGGFSVIGNLMQQGFLLEFDRDRSRLGFSLRGCAIP